MAAAALSEEKPQSTYKALHLLAALPAHQFFADAYVRHFQQRGATAHNDAEARALCRQAFELRPLGVDGMARYRFTAQLNVEETLTKFAERVRAERATRHAALRLDLALGRINCTYTDLDPGLYPEPPTVAWQLHRALGSSGSGSGGPLTSVREAQLLRTQLVVPRTLTFAEPHELLREAARNAPAGYDRLRLLVCEWFGKQAALDEACRLFVAWTNGESLLQ